MVKQMQCLSTSKSMKNKIDDNRQATMTRNSLHSILILLAASGLALAQNEAPPPTTAPMQSAGPADAYGQPQRTAGAPAATRPAYGLPQSVTLKPGTFVTVRINEMLASNKNQPGDSFTGTLAQPIVIDGVVVAQRGQSIFGRVSQAEKIKGVSHLGVELTNITFADGEQFPVHSQLISRRGGTTPPGVEAGAIVGTTATGAVIGGIAGHGTGAAIGAGAGVAAGIIGVLVTHNHPSVIYPETALTFQVLNPLTIATGNAPAAFRFAGPDDYTPAQPAQRVVVQRPGYYGAYPYYGYYGYGYPYYPYWGPSVYVGGYWGGGFRFGGGYHRFR
jgi:hypothetical protein